MRLITSSVGMFASRRAAGGTGSAGGDHANEVGGLDSRVKLGTNWVAVAQSVVSRTATESGDARTGSALLASLVRSGRSFNFQLDANDRSRDFRADAGFIQRVDVRSIDQTATYRFRPAWRGLISWGPDVLTGRSWDRAGDRLDWYAMPRLAFEWPRLTSLTVYYRASRERVRPLEVPWLRESVDTRADRRGFDFVTNASARLIGSLSVSQGDGVNLTPTVGEVPTPGSLFNMNFTASVRFSHALSVDGTYLLDRLSDSESDARVYADRIYRLRVTDQFTRAWSMRAIVQYGWTAALLITCASAAKAQETTGTISGRIVDAQGLAVPGVTVTATGPQGTKTTVTGNDGRFTIPFLAPGTYRIHTDLAGFKPIVREDVQVRLGQTADLSFTIQIGDVNETVQVTGSAAIVDRTSTTIGANLDSATLSRLPIGRRFSDTLRLEF